MVVFRGGAKTTTGGAPMVPLTWLNLSFLWSSRVHGWVYNPTTAAPDLTAVWLDPEPPAPSP